MKIELYQINMERDKEHLAFMDLSSDKVDRTLYDKVFEGDVDSDTLEDVFYVFNVKHPEGYTGRSMSVSDVVHILPGSKTPEGFYFCRSIGWTKIDF